MTQGLKGILIILLVYLLGEITSRLIGGFMPGSVIGMVYLFTALQLGIIKEEQVKSICDFVLGNMMLYFVPVTVGLIVSYHIIAESWIVIVLMLIASTLMVFIIVALIQQFLAKRWKH